VSFFVAHYATIEDVVAEFDRPDISMEGMAFPRFSGAYERREDAAEKTRRAAMESLIQVFRVDPDDRDGKRAQQSFERAYLGGTWTEGEWQAIGKGRPRCVHRYRKDGRLIALVVVEYVEVE